MKRPFTLISGLVLAFIILITTGIQAAQKPNVVFVLMDNFG
jgi:hypothetical protein